LLTVVDKATGAKALGFDDVLGRLDDAVAIALAIT
jgi:hypothetical protein